MRFLRATHGRYVNIAQIVTFHLEHDDTGDGKWRIVAELAVAIDRRHNPTSLIVLHEFTRPNMTPEEAAREYMRLVAAWNEGKDPRE